MTPMAGHSVGDNPSKWVTKDAVGVLGPVSPTIRSGLTHRLTRQARYYKKHGRSSKDYLAISC